MTRVFCGPTPCSFSVSFPFLPEYVFGILRVCRDVNCVPLVQRRLLLRPYTSPMWLGIEFHVESNSCQDFKVLFHFLLAPRVAPQAPCHPASGSLNVDAALFPAPTDLTVPKMSPGMGAGCGTSEAVVLRHVLVLLTP